MPPFRRIILFTQSEVTDDSILQCGRNILRKSSVTSSSGLPPASQEPWENEFQLPAVRRKWFYQNLELPLAYGLVPPARVAEWLVRILLVGCSAQRSISSVLAEIYQLLCSDTRLSSCPVVPRSWFFFFEERINISRIDISGLSRWAARGTAPKDEPTC